MLVHSCGFPLGFGWGEGRNTAAIVSLPTVSWGSPQALANMWCRMLSAPVLLAHNGAPVLVPTPVKWKQCSFCWVHDDDEFKISIPFPSLVSWPLFRSEWLEGAGVCPANVVIKVFDWSEDAWFTTLTLGILCLNLASYLLYFTAVESIGTSALLLQWWCR